MMAYNILYYSLQTTVLAVLIFASSFAVTQAQAQDAPVVWTTDDSQLEWGPCPEFMPDGCEMAVLQGDPTQENTDVFFKMAPNSTVPVHVHTSVERMVLVSGEMHVDYEGHEPVVMTQGAYAYGPAELPHETYCAESDECILFIAFEDPVDAVPVESP